MKGERNLTFFIFINMAEQSQFSKLSKIQLVSISVKLIDQDFPIGNPYESDYDDAYSILEEVSRYYSIEVTNEDVEFFSKFLEINDEIIADLFANNKEQMKNRELIEQLVIPVAKSYNMDYSSWGSCNYTNNMTQEFDSYDEEWVKDSATQQLNDGNWNMWDGQERSSTEYDDFQESDYRFDDVYEVDESKIKNESVLDKLVIENTSEVIGSLDKKTLIKLKSIIESRLRLL
jgi:S-adenosylmethionine/arginine decarboxylase-like enzyme